MKILRQILELGIIILAMRFVPASNAQTIAPPQSLPTCIIAYYPMNALGNFRVVEYNQDGSYFVVYSAGTGPFQTPYIVGDSYPDQSGTYTYSIDPSNPQNAIIAYSPKTGAANPPVDSLMFTSTTAGFGGGGVFNLFPSQIGNGASNISNRCTLAQGGNSILGFVVQSNGPRWILLRAVGVTLNDFGVTATVTGPQITLYNSSNQVVARSLVWSQEPNFVNGFSAVFNLVGAFPLNLDSDEGIIIIPLSPGTYTAVISASSPGNILCEMYMLPF